MTSRSAARNDRLHSCLRASAWVCGLLLLASPALAQRDKNVRELQDQAFVSFSASDYAGAETALRELVRLDEWNFVHWYNLACARALQGDPKEAGELLKEAVARGFIDLRQLKTDPNLAAVRGDPNYEAIVANWPKVVDAHKSYLVRQAAHLFSGKYETVTDDNLRVIYLSAFDPGSFQKARDEITRLSAWGIKNVFTDLAPKPAPAGEDDKAGAGDPLTLDPWVVVALPKQADFNRWTAATYGPGATVGFGTVGGAYNHDEKRLVAQDLGPTLRHEFFHVLHWRSNTRAGQVHPPWVQEGLCSLVEDYDVVGGDLVPVPSWRSNIVKRLLRAGKLQKLTELAAVSHSKFVGSRPLAWYAHSRTVFLFLHHTGKLKAWYAEYTAHYDDDPTGVEALTKVYGAPIADVENDFRAFVKALPEVAEEIPFGGASLGVEIDAGTGDGPVIQAISRPVARTAGLRPGDVITAIDGRPTRDLAELIRVLGQYQPGQRVKVEYRRGKQHGEADLQLTPKN